MHARITLQNYKKSKQVITVYICTETTHWSVVVRQSEIK